MKQFALGLCDQEGHQKTSLCSGSSLVELNFILSAQDSLEMDYEYLSHFI